MKQYVVSGVSVSNMFFSAERRQVALREGVAELQRGVVRVGGRAGDGVPGRRRRTRRRAPRPRRAALYRRRASRHVQRPPRTGANCFILGVCASVWVKRSPRCVARHERARSLTVVLLVAGGVDARVPRLHGDHHDPRDNDQPACARSRDHAVRHVSVSPQMRCFFQQTFCHRL